MFYFAGRGGYNSREATVQERLNNLYFIQKLFSPAKLELCHEKVFVKHYLYLVATYI